jgi:CTP:molybdopterin cytidylyltransferase MocA
MSGAGHDEAAAVVLAAGPGRRFGGPKALVELDGELLVERAARIAAAGGCRPVIVVLGSHAEEVRARADLDATTTVIASRWSDGMGASLRTGIAAADELGLPAIVVMLVDQPRIGPEGLRRLVSAWRAGADAAVATYGGQPRNPVVLDRSIWAEVSEAARGDVGARGWLRDHPDRVVRVDCDDTGDPVDIDTQQDLSAMKDGP